MAEYIEREAVLKWIDFVSDGYSYLETGTEFAKRDIKAIPAADVRPVMRGKWEYDGQTAKFGNPFRCTRCHEENNDTYNFCPNCGADMREVEHEA